MAYARANTIHSIKSLVEQHPKDLHPKDQVDHVFHIINQEEGNWERMAVLRIFIEKLVEDFIINKNRARVLSLTEEFIAENNNAVLGDWVKTGN